MTVILMLTLNEPPVLLPQIVYVVVVHNSVAIPHIVPFVGPKFKPAGKVPSISQVSTSPEFGPWFVGIRGRSALPVLFVKVIFCGL